MPRTKQVRKTRNYKPYKTVDITKEQCQGSGNEKDEKGDVRSENKIKRTRKTEKNKYIYCRPSRFQRSHYGPSDLWGFAKKARDLNFGIEDSEDYEYLDDSEYDEAFTLFKTPPIDKDNLYYSMKTFAGGRPDLNLRHFKEFFYGSEGDVVFFKFDDLYGSKNIGIVKHGMVVCVQFNPCFPNEAIFLFGTANFDIVDEEEVAESLIKRDIDRAILSIEEKLAVRDISELASILSSCKDISPDFKCMISVLMNLYDFIDNQFENASEDVALTTENIKKIYQHINNDLHEIFLNIQENEIDWNGVILVTHAMKLLIEYAKTLE